MSFKQNLRAFITIGLLGTLGHFFYEWSGNLYAVGLFFPVNESTWEHLKLLFYPTIIYSVSEYFLIKNKPKGYINATTSSLLWGMLSIVVLFYTYKGVIGKNIDFLNIVIYFIAIIIMLALRQKRLKYPYIYSGINLVSLTVILILFILFSIFSYNPPELGLFAPPNILNT